MGAVTIPGGLLTALVVLAGAGGCTAGPVDPPVAPGASAPGQATAATAALPPVDCAASVRTGPLPVWARDGFRGDGSSYRHVEGLRGEVVGVLFGFPLTSPPRPSRANKILWVAQTPTSGRLRIDARLDGAGPVVTREVGFGGGQSLVDLPDPGCWRLTLRWGEGVTDTVDLPWVPRR